MSDDEIQLCIKKQTPLKQMIIKEDTYCGACGQLLNSIHKWCWYCGQKQEVDIKTKDQGK